MKKYKSYIGKVALIGSITLTGYLCNASDSNAAYKGFNNITYLQASTTTRAVSADTTQSSDTLYPVAVQVDDSIKYGYIDATGKMVIQPTYEIANDFSEGYAVVYNGKMSQVINSKGSVIFETEGSIQSFHNGLAAFSDPQNDYKQGYINTKGKVVIKPNYTFAGDFRSDNTAYVSKSDKYYMIDSAGKIVKSYKFDGKYTYYDITKDGYIIINDQDTFLKGVMDLSGKIIIKPIYGEITALGDGLFGVKKKLSDENAYLMSIQPSALFDSNGKRLTSYKYYDLTSFHDGFASATDNKYTYLIDRSGKKVTDLPTLEGKGTMEVYGDLIKADIDTELLYVKKDGTTIWKKDDTTKLSSGITVSTVKVKPNKYAIVYYPKVDGINDSKVEASINTKLKDLFMNERKNLKVSDYLSVTDQFTVSQIKDLLIVNKTGYDYPIGAAHGIPLSIYYFANVNTGDFYQLKDLFKSNSNYVSKLSDIVRMQIKKENDNGASYYFDSKTLISKEQHFYVDKDTLTIYFDCGAIAAYAAGFPKFEIPFKDISSIVNKEGAFWKAFH
ncbi:MAG TPA: WG repeat-containing protein [Lachnospiraceae bacterium]|nr:WG repeat-containing protein [Lachnospiraceae bacterium]